MDEAIRSEINAEGIAVVRLKVPDESRNIITLSLLTALDETFKQLAQRPGLRGVVVISDQPGSFIAGADVRLLLACESRSATVALARRGQAFCHRVAHFPVPVVAAIDGECLGSGVAFALACQGRVASNERHTCLGLPEIQLGLLPAGGTTQRLPERVGLLRAFDLMLTGRQLYASQAAAISLVDEVVSAAVLLEAAYRRVEALRRNPNTPTRSVLLRQMLENTAIVQQLILNRARQRLRESPQHHHPARLAIVDCVEYGVRKPAAISLEYEAERFGELWQTRQARALMGLYFATQGLKKPVNNTRPQVVDAIAVLGSGQMGARIAALSSHAGLRVRLKDNQTSALLDGLRYVDEQTEQALKDQHITAFVAAQQRRRVTPTTDYRGLRGYPLVIEAAYEDLALKQQLLREVEQLGRREVIFASSTSSLPITSIAEYAERPDHVIGMHYAAPAEHMSLLEVVVTPQTDPAVVATAAALGQRQGKKVIVVNDGAGFYLNRILAPYLNEAGHLLLEGVPVESIDTALERFGFSIGPLAFLDCVGIDIAARVGQVLQHYIGERLQPPPLLERLLEAGRQGVKNHRGFYRYRQHHQWRRQRPVDSRIYAELGIGRGTVMSADDIAERCVLAMLNEAVRCRDEGIIRSERDGDLGAVFGVGFPAFRGGPFHYLHQIGPETVVKHLHRLARCYGARFEPASGLNQHSSANVSH